MRAATVASATGYALAVAVAVPAGLFVLVAFGGLIVIYSVDFVRDWAIVGFLLLVIFVPIGLLLIYWAAMAIYIPAAMSLSADSSVAQRVVSVALVPLGALFAFLLWQAQNWLIYGVIDIDSWLYNKVFSPLGLDV